MILVDANLLIYAGTEGSYHHEQASAWLREQFEAGYKVGLPWHSLLAFLRVTTNARLYERPASIDAALSVVEGWLRIETVWCPGPGSRHSRILGDLLRGVDAQSSLVPDAHLAALAMEHGLELCSADRDFSRFEGLRWRNPLARGKAG